MDHSKQLGEKGITELLVKFSIPAIAGMLVNGLYSVVDRAFVGNSAGSLGIAGITVGFPLMLIMLASMMLVGIGANSLVSIRLGEKKKEEAELIMGNAFSLLLIICLGITILGLAFLNQLLRLFGASEAVMPYASEYMRIILLGTVFQGVGFGMNNFIRGEGNPQIAMFTMLIGGILNTILSPLMIFTMGMGFKGSAIATVISQAVSAAWVMYYFLGGRSVLKLRKKNLRLDKAIVSKVFSLGSAPFSLQLAASLVNLIMNRSLVVYGGDLAISAVGIVNSILTLIVMPIFGLNQGVQPIIGYNYGAKRFDRVKSALKKAIAVATAIVFIGFVVVQLIPYQIVGLFGKEDPKLMEFSAHALRVFLIFLPIIGFQIISANYFQAVGKPKHAMFLSLSRQVLLLIPAVLILPLFFGLNGLLFAGPVADLLSSILTAAWLFIELKYLDKKHESSFVSAAQPE